MLKTITTTGRGSMCLINRCGKRTEMLKLTAFGRGSKCLNNNYVWQGVEVFKQ